MVISSPSLRLFSFGTRVSSVLFSSARAIEPSIIPASSEAEDTAATERSGERIVLTTDDSEDTSIVIPIRPSPVTTGQYGLIPSFEPLSMVNDLKGSLAVYEITLHGSDNIRSSCFSLIPTNLRSSSSSAFVDS